MAMKGVTYYVVLKATILVLFAGSVEAQTVTMPAPGVGCRSHYDIRLLARKIHRELAGVAQAAELA